MLSVLETSLSSSLTRPLAPEDAAVVQRLYAATPDYLRILSIEVPSVAEIAQDLRTAVQDVLRHSELVLCPTYPMEQAIRLSGWDVRDPRTGRMVVGYLDYKTDYPQDGQVMVNVILIPTVLQGQGWGSRAIRALEQRLHTNYKQILASIYGKNEAATRFWQRLGYQHVLDARPIIDWYGKALPEQGHHAHEQARQPQSQRTQPGQTQPGQIQSASVSSRGLET